VLEGELRRWPKDCIFAPAVLYFVALPGQYQLHLYIAVIEERLQMQQLCCQ
jgi:hypothetical protein